MSVPFQIGGGITIGGGISAGPDVVVNVPTFTITSSDFNNGASQNPFIFPQGANGNEGFINGSPTPISNPNNYYFGNLMTAGSIASISSALTQAGIDPATGNGFIWNATWAAGSNISNGLVNFSFYDGSGFGTAAFAIQPINPDGNAWQTPGAVGNTLAGRFNFPATFTIYTPLTYKGNIL